jgi:hypothetical protein
LLGGGKGIPRQQSGGYQDSGRQAKKMMNGG